MAAALVAASCGCAIDDDGVTECSVCGISACFVCRNNERPADEYVADDGTQHILREAIREYIDCGTCSRWYCEECDDTLYWWGATRRTVSAAFSYAHYAKETMCARPVQHSPARGTSSARAAIWRNVGFTASITQHATNVHSLGAVIVNRRTLNPATRAARASAPTASTMATSSTARPPATFSAPRAFRRGWRA